MRGIEALNSGKSLAEFVTEADSFVPASQFTSLPLSISVVFKIEMPLKDSYVIWNNKGGVGKSTITFHMATEYAFLHENERVLVIDLCPQANVSMALLSNPNTHGSEHVSKLHREKKTICYYLEDLKSPLANPKPSKYLTSVHDYNPYVPENVSLLCGDMSLELVGRNIEELRRIPPGADGLIPWVFYTCAVRWFIEGYRGKVKGVTTNQDDWVVFIDTNPAFSVYTEIALVSARKLIIPINADDFSRAAIKSMLDLVYGVGNEEVSASFSAYREYLFSSKADLHGIAKPKIHLLINNRTTMYGTRAAKSFRAMAQANLDVLYTAYQEHQECFAERTGGENISNQKSFEKQYLYHLRDFHSVAILSLHTGCPLKSLKEFVGSVQVFQENVRPRGDNLDNCIEGLNNLVERRL